MRQETDLYMAAKLVSKISSASLGVCVAFLIINFMTWREEFEFLLIARGIVLTVALIIPVYYVERWEEIDQDGES